MARWIAVGAVGAACVAPTGASAATGELAHVGAFGASAGQFKWPHDLAVDPSDNSAYVLDDPQGELISSPVTSFRVQKFSSSPSLSGTPVATLTVPTPAVAAQAQRAVAIAVDPVLHRLYVLKQIHTLSGIEADELSASEVDAYSTEQVGGVLPPAPGVPMQTVGGVEQPVFYKFPLPTSTTQPAGTLGTPQGLAVDPSTHDLIVLGSGEAHETLIQRLHASAPSYANGALSASLDDTSETVARHAATGVTVGPEGSLYLVAARAGGEIAPGVVKVSPDFSKVSIVHLDESESVQLNGGETSAGSQISLSSDGSTVYAGEASLEEAGGAPNTAGHYEIRGMSTATGSQQVVLGGAPFVSRQSRCVIASRANAIAAGSGGVVFALDEGAPQPPNQAEGTAFGFSLVEFGPGGGGCPAPATSFTVNSDEHSETVRVEKGAEVTLLASTSELNGAEPTSLEWMGSGPEPYPAQVVTTGCPSTPATCLKTTHRFLTPGAYAVKLNMQVSNSTFGPPPVVTRSVEVFAPAPTASFEVTSTNLKPGEAVTFNASGSLDPTGTCSTEHGCTPSHHLKEYVWSFGDGSIQTTTTPELTRSFANSSTSARSETVTLVVTNGEGTHSSPTTQTLTVGGSPGGKPLEEQHPSITPPSTGPALITLDRSATNVNPHLATGSGVVQLTVSCPTTKVSCAGTVQLRTILKKGKHKTQSVAIGSGSFSLVRGAKKTVILHLSHAGQLLLRRLHTLKLTVTVVAHDSLGDPKTTALTLVLHSPKKKH